MIDVCAEHGDVEKAAEIFVKMRSAGELPDVVTFSSLLNDRAKQGDIKKVEEIFEWRRAGGMLPNVATFSSLVKNAAENVEKMKSASELPDEVKVNSSITQNAEEI